MSATKLIVTKTVLAMAQKRGMEVWLDETSLDIYQNIGDGEPWFMYRVDSDGFHFWGQVFGSKVEDMPNWINTTTKLKEILVYLGSIK